MIAYSLIFFILLNKIISFPYLFNFLFLPYLGYLYLSKNSISRNKIFSISALLFSFFLIFFTLTNAGRSESIQFLLFRSLSFSTFIVSIFGLIPFNLSFIRSFRIPILISIPALFFLSSQPTFYTGTTAVDFSGNLGLFGFKGLVGVFNSSFYFAQILTGWLLIKQSIGQTNLKLSLLFKKNQNLDFLILLILLFFTNRKAFMILLLFAPLKNIFRSILNVFEKSKLSLKSLLSLVASLLIFSGIIVGYEYGFKIQLVNNYNFVLDTFNRIQIYFNYSFFNSESNPFSDTTYTYFREISGNFSFLIIVIYLLAVINSLIRLKKIGIFNFLTYNSLIILIFFKEAATVLSPSPSSLLIFMIISYLISSSYREEKIKEFFLPIYQKKSSKK